MNSGWEMRPTSCPFHPLCHRVQFSPVFPAKCVQDVLEIHALAALAEDAEESILGKAALMS